MGGDTTKRLGRIKNNNQWGKRVTSNAIQETLELNVLSMKLYIIHHERPSAALPEVHPPRMLGQKNAIDAPVCERGKTTTIMLTCAAPAIG
jgi:hypothetical protein